MNESARRRANYDDVLQAPPNTVAEVLNGTLHVQSRPSMGRTRVRSRLGAKLAGPFDFGDDGPGGWVLLDEPELHLGDATRADIVVPDLGGWRRERMPEVPLERPWVDIAPDWICEILSPSTEAIDRADKMDLYARQAVKHAWLVDPGSQTLEVYGLRGDCWLRIGVWRGQALVRAEPFAELELDLAWLWAR